MTWVHTKGKPSTVGLSLRSPINTTRSWARVSVWRSKAKSCEQIANTYSHNYLDRCADPVERQRRTRVLMTIDGGFSDGSFNVLNVFSTHQTSSCASSNGLHNWLACRSQQSRLPLEFDTTSSSRNTAGLNALIEQWHSLPSNICPAFFEWWTHYRVSRENFPGMKENWAALCVWSDLLIIKIISTVGAYFLRSDLSVHYGATIFTFVNNVQIETDYIVKHSDHS